MRYPIGATGPTSFSEEQLLLRATVRRVAGELLALRAREVEAAGGDFPLDLLPRMAEVGLLGLDIPRSTARVTFRTALVLEEPAAG